MNLRLTLLALLLAAACSKSSAPTPVRSDPAALSDAQKWRELRTARLNAGIAEQRKQFPELRNLPEKFTTGYARVQKHLLLDASADCVTMERVGTKGDGGKWICNGYRLQPPCVVYAVGAADEISFDEQMAEKYGCDVHVIDPSAKSRASFGKLEKGEARGKGKVTYHPWAIGPVSENPAEAMKLNLDGQDCVVKTLAQIAAELGHQKVDVLKLDIEGGEFAALKEMRKSGSLKKLGVKQLQVEFHTHDLPHFGMLVDEIEALLDADYVMFRKELNPYGVECCSEFAFADKAFLLD